MIIKLERDVVWADLPNIESPIVSYHHVTLDFFHFSDRPRIYGLEYAFSKEYPGIPFEPTHTTLELIRTSLVNGKMFLIHITEAKPFTPMLKWKEDGDRHGKGKWVQDGFDFGGTLAFYVEWMTSRLHDPKTMMEWEYPKLSIVETTLPPVKETKTTHIDLEYLHTDRTPVPKASYKVVAINTDGTDSGAFSYSGKLDSQGKAHIDGVPFALYHYKKILTGI